MTEETQFNTCGNVNLISVPISAHLALGLALYPLNPSGYPNCPWKYISAQIIVLACRSTLVDVWWLAAPSMKILVGLIPIFKLWKGASIIRFFWSVSRSISQTMEKNSNRFKSPNWTYTWETKLWEKLARLPKCCFLRPGLLFLVNGS